MRLPRYRLRTLLIAVAVAALGMGTIVGLARRRESYLRQAAHHGKLSNERGCTPCTSTADTHWGPSEPERVEMAAYERRGHYHAALQAKYERVPATPGSPSSQTRRSRIDFLRAQAVNINDSLQIGVDMDCNLLTPPGEPKLYLASGSA